MIVKHDSLRFAVRLFVLTMTSYLALSIAAVFAESLTLNPDKTGVQRATIVMESYAYSPDHVIVQADYPIELTLENVSFLTPHNFVLDYPSIGLTVNRTVSAGETAVLELPSIPPGLYTFYCDKQLLFFPSHREEGMEGRLEAR